MQCLLSTPAVSFRGMFWSFSRVLCSHFMLLARLSHADCLVVVALLGLGRVPLVSFLTPARHFPNGRLPVFPPSPRVGRSLPLPPFLLPWPPLAFVASCPVRVFSRLRRKTFPCRGSAARSATSTFRTPLWPPIVVRPRQPQLRPLCPALSVPLGCMFACGPLFWPPAPVGLARAPLADDFATVQSLPCCFAGASLLPVGGWFLTHLCAACLVQRWSVCVRSPAAASSSLLSTGTALPPCRLYALGVPSPPSATYFVNSPPSPRTTSSARPFDKARDVASITRPRPLRVGRSLFVSPASRPVSAGPVALSCRLSMAFGASVAAIRAPACVPTCCNRFASAELRLIDEPLVPPTFLAASTFLVFRIFLFSQQYVNAQSASGWTALLGVAP